MCVCEWLNDSKEKKQKESELGREHARKGTRERDREKARERDSRETMREGKRGACRYSRENKRMENDEREIEGEREKANEDCV